MSEPEVHAAVRAEGLTLVPASSKSSKTGFKYVYASYGRFTADFSCNGVRRSFLSRRH